MTRRVSRFFPIALFIVVAIVAISTPLRAIADVRLPKVIDSHMVVQRDRPLPIWGWADAGEEVTVKLDDASVKATADGQGNWQVILPAMKADGKAHSMTVSKTRLNSEDILIGEVPRVGSGQSEYGNGRRMCHKAKEEIAFLAEHPQIRLLLVPKTAARRPKTSTAMGRMHPKTIAEGG